MFQTLTPPPGDPILKVMTLYREDPRKAKVDLGLGDSDKRSARVSETPGI